MAHVIRFLLRHRRWVLLGILVSLGLAGYAAREIQVRFQYRDFYDYPGNPDMPLFSRYSTEFGDPAGFVVVLVETDDVFRNDVLEYVRTITHELEREAMFSHVHSLANAKATFGDGDEVTAGELMAELPATPEQTERIRKAAVGSSLLVRRVVSADSKATVVLAEMRTPATLASIKEQKQAIGIVRSAIARHPAPATVRVRITGGPVAEVETTRSLTRDILIFTPAAILVIALALFFTFRSIQGVIVPLAAVSVSVLWTAGIFAILDHPVDIVGSTMPATLLVYGVVDPIFHLTRYMEKREEGCNHEDAIVGALSDLALPCFITSLTTALGFASFATATLPTVGRYGITAAIGIALAWVTTVVVLPFLLLWLPPPVRHVASATRSQWVPRAMTGLWRWMRPRIRWVIAGATVLLLAGGFYAREQHISSIYVANLPAGEALDSIHTLERKLSGVIRTVVYFEGDPGSMKRPEVLRAIAAIDEFAEKVPYVNTSVSLADLIAEVNQAFNGGDPAAHRIPKSGSLIAQYLAMIDPEDRADFVDAEYARTHIRILTSDPGSETFRELRVALQKQIDEEFKGLNVKVSLTGTAMVGYAALDQIVIEMLYGFIVAFAIIVIVVLVLFRSLRLALISVAPNVLPVIASFACMRLFDISLRMDTCLFLSVCVGGLFNNTIQLAGRVRLGLRQGERDPDVVMEETFQVIGRPALFTAVILSLGFATFMLSGFPGLRAFGLLSMVTLIAGFLCDMIFTTALLRKFYNWKHPEDR